MRVKGDHLDTNDTKTAQAGGPGGDVLTVLGGDGKPAVGCVVRHEAEGGLRAFGLIRKERWSGGK